MAERVWTRTGSQGLIWRKASIINSFATDDFYFEYEAVSGIDGFSYVAIDDIEFEDSTECPSSNECDFEVDKCIFVTIKITKNFSFKVGFCNWEDISANADLMCWHRAKNGTNGTGSGAR